MMYIITPLCGFNVTSGPGVCCAHVGGSNNGHMSVRDKRTCDCVRMCVCVCVCACTCMYDEAMSLKDKVYFQGVIAIPVLLGGMFGVT